jgi:subtilisin family serine protease/uncharacterized cupredoxin-like copper-binding protein
MIRGRRNARFFFTAGVVLLGSVLAGMVSPAGGTSRPPAVAPALLARAQKDGALRVIVALRLPSGKSRPEGRLTSRAMLDSQRAEIAATQSGVLARVVGKHRLWHRFETVPFVALEVDPAGLAALAADPDVEQVVEDRLVAPVLAQSVPLVQADLAWDFGYDGTGQVVAIIDSGVDNTHPFLAGKVVSEACYASGGSCPNGQSTQIGVGAGVPCPFDPDACLHGTHVAGIAAGSGTTFSGVARGADLIAIQVFHSSTTDCIPFFENVPCARAFSSDIGAGLERIYALRTQYAIASVNLSLGGGKFTSNCDGEEPQLTAQINNLRSVGIATVIASGNDGNTRALAFPACISSAVSVGSTTKGDEVSSFSNVASFLSLFAPGEGINSSVPGGGFEILDGTSMAAPHVAGAWAIMRQADPNLTVSATLNLLKQTGLPITDTRGRPPITKPRIRLANALGITLPVPALTSVSPPAINAWGPGFNLTVTGTSFFHSSVVRLNGVARPTTYLSPTTLTAAIPAGDIASTAATATITVFTPAPGGGTSGPSTLTLRQPVLSVSASSVLAGSPVTVTLTNAPGGTLDWLALATVGSADTSYVQWTYLPAGALSTTWTVTVSPPGSYEFRLFTNGGFTRVAKSPTVTASPGPPPVLSVSSTSVPAGGQATVTLTNGPGGAQDWLAVAASGSPNTSNVQWTYVGAGVTTRTWTVTLPTPGSYEFRLFLDGGHTRAATSPTVTVQYAATLAVSATSVPAGGQVTVTLANGAGGSQDWLAFAAVGSPDTTNVQWTYVGAGVTTRTWTVTAPTAGSYEFRLFLDGQYTRAATSPAITVGSAATPALSASATSVPSGGQVTLTLTNGPGGAQDWLALAAVGSPDTSYLLWTYVGAGVTTRTWTVTLSTPGSYEFRLFVGGSSTRTATSPAVTVNAGPALSVSATSVPTGGQVTVTLTNGPGGAQDWLALAEVGSPDTSYVQSTAVGAGVTTRTWTVTLSTPGSYEFRLFPDGGYTRAATSPAVSVTGGAGPALNVSATTIPIGGPVTVTLSNGLGGAQDWLALVAVGSPDTSYLQWTYVGSGLTTRTWTVTLSTPGSYEFRLFLNGGYTRAATSPAVTVPAGSPALSVSATSVPAGGQVTVTLSNGPGGAQDWLALAQVGSADTSNVQWTYVGAGITTRTWTVTLTTPGSYEFRLFLDGGHTRAATSAAVTVEFAASLAVSATSVPVGGQATVTLSNGLGGEWDWLALAAVGSPDTSNVQWIYVGAGVTTRTWTVTLTAPGSYEFRLFLNDGYTRAATSPTVTAVP